MVIKPIFYKNIYKTKGFIDIDLFELNLIYNYNYKRMNQTQLIKQNEFQLILEHQHPKHELNSTPNVFKQKTKIKNIQNQIRAKQNRLLLLNEQMLKQKQKVNKKKQKTKQIIARKLNMNRILEEKQRYINQNIERQQLLKRRNQQFRQSHDRELKTILQACYLVKLQQAKQIKNLSIEHQKKIQKIRDQTFEQKKKKKDKIKSIKSNAKQRYNSYWKNKIVNSYDFQSSKQRSVSQTKQQKIIRLKQLEQQQIKLLQKINKIHQQNNEVKKQYETALNIPVKQVADLMGMQTQQKSEVKKSKAQTQRVRNKGIEKIEYSRLPKTNLNEEKLKLIINELKKKQLLKQ